MRGHRRIGDAGDADRRLFIVQIIILQAAFSPLTQMVIEIRSGAGATTLAVIQVKDSIQFVVQEPGVTTQQKRSEPAPVTGNDVEVVGMHAEVTRIEWK